MDTILHNEIAVESVQSLTAFIQKYIILINTLHTVQFTCKFTTHNGLNASISRFIKRHEASHACCARVKKYVEY